MGQPIAFVDSFTDTAFSGNPAAVCMLPAAADEAWMQAVATEMNLPATTFVVPRTDGDYDVRWFTPSVEIDICGHGTLATTHVLGKPARFHTKSGILTGRPTDDGVIELDFPAIPVEPAADPPELSVILGLTPDKVAGVWAGGEWLLVEVATPDDVRVAAPGRMAVLGLGDVVVVVVATPGDRKGVDSVCRVFQPAFGLDEDPVTGSAHCVIARWLAERTGRTELSGEQASPRGGTVGMRLSGDNSRVTLSGHAVTVLEGVLQIEPPVGVG